MTGLLGSAASPFVFFVSFVDESYTNQAMQSAWSRHQRISAST